MEEIRLQKYFTDCGVLSRRAAEDEIKAGLLGEKRRKAYESKINQLKILYPVDMASF